MMDLTGYLTINETDCWTEFSAFLCELSAAATVNKVELLKAPKMKAYTVVSFRERNGEDLPEELPVPQYEAIDRSLQFCVYDTTMDGAIAKYNALLALMKNGWLRVVAKDICTRKMYYQEQSEPTWYDDARHPACVFKVKFREPKPGEL